MEEFHKEDLEKFRVRILDYLSYLLNNIPINIEDNSTRERIHYYIDICLDAEKGGIKFDRVKYLVDELKKIESNNNDIMTMQQFFLAMERNEKLENLGI